MRTTEVQIELSLFGEMCDRHFSFLVEEFGMRVVPDGQAWRLSYARQELSPGNLDGHAVRVYQNETTGVSVQTIELGRALSVSVMRLEGGALPEEPPRPVETYRGKQQVLYLALLSHYLNPKSRLHRLNECLRVSPIAGSRPEPEQRQAYDAVFRANAQNLRENCAEILRGDFTAFDELEALPKEDFTAFLGFQLSRTLPRRAAARTAKPRPSGRLA